MVAADTTITQIFQKSFDLCCFDYSSDRLCLSLVKSLYK